MGGVLWEMQLGRALSEKRPRTPILSKKLSHHVFYGNWRKRGRLSWTLAAAEGGGGGGNVRETDELTRKQVDQGGKQTETQASDLHLGLQ